MVTSEMVTSLLHTTAGLQEWGRSRNAPAGMCLLLTFSISIQILSAQPGSIISPLELLAWDNEKRDVIIARLTVSQPEAEQFWRFYERYERSRRSLCRGRLKTLSLYNTCSTRRMKAITRKLLSNDLAFEQMYTNYYRSLRKILTPRRAAQFLMMEKHFQAVLNSHVDSLALSLSPTTARRVKK